MCVDMRGYVGDSGTPGVECPKVAEPGLKLLPASSDPAILAPDLRLLLHLDVPLGEETEHGPSY